VFGLRFGKKPHHKVGPVLLKLFHNVTRVTGIPITERSLAELTR